VNVLAFCVLGFMLTAYVLLDGYDLGVAVIVPFVARTDGQRRAALQAIGPFWNGNEVWLIAAGGSLFAFFPQAYASALSGFYLPLTVMLWLLMGRGIALELREHFPSAVWHQFWDGVFSFASALLILLLGVTLGNVVRGVPLDAQGYFNGTFAFLLNWYALLLGIVALVALALHGATFLAWRVDGALGQAAHALAKRLWYAAVLGTIAMSFATAAEHATDWGYVAGAVGLIALVAVQLDFRRGAGPIAFAASSVWIAGLMMAAAGVMFPYVLPAFPRGAGGISIDSAAASAPALASALVVTIVGIVAVCIYSVVVWRRLAGKVPSGE